jgi:hypothetical protein
MRSAGTLSPGEGHGDQKQRHRHPDPEQCAHKNIPPPPAKKAAHADRCNLERAPGKEVAGVAEGAEERDAVPPVGHGVEHTVGSRRHEKTGYQQPPLLRESLHSGERCDRDQNSNKKSEQGGMRETAVAQGGAVPHSEKESDHVNVRQERADNRQDPEARGHALREYQLPGGKGDKTMGEGGGHD